MEIYRNSSQQLIFKLYSNRTLTNADSMPSVTLKLNGVALPPHVVTKEADGVYATQLLFADTFEEGELEATWTFVFNTVVSTKQEFHSIVTPYVDLNYLYELPHSDDQIKWAEFYSRSQIEKYTGQKFGRRKAWVKSQGNGTDVLILPEHAIAATHLYENGSLLWEQGGTNNSVTNLSISPSGFAVQISDNWDVRESAPTGFLYSGGRFVEGYTYEVMGEFGYRAVPEDVTMSANMLVDDWFCKDKAWREKYATKITNGDWSVEISKRVFEGTGNSIVDATLSDYMWHRMVVV
jgi:hypothetical protein